MPLPHALTLLISLFPKHPECFLPTTGPSHLLCLPPGTPSLVSPQRPLYLFQVSAQISPSRELPGGPMGRNSMFSLLSAWVQCLVGELRSHRLHGMARENSITFQRDLPALSANLGTQDPGLQLQPHCVALSYLKLHHLITWPPSVFPLETVGSIRVEKRSPW